MAGRRTSGRAGLQLPALRELPAYFISVAFHAADTFQSLTLVGKAAVALLALAYAAITIVVIRLGPHGVLEHLAQFSDLFARSSFGPLALVLILTILSFPPTVGYGTAITLCGLAFGSPVTQPGNGLFYAWTIAATGCLFGSLVAFLVCRFAFSKHLGQWQWVRKLREGREWRAMERAVESKGGKMILLIRFCPFPFAVSNLFLASLRPSVVPVHFFVLATLATTPKLFLHVFIGAQTLEAIRGGGDAGASTQGSYVKVIYIAAASAIGALTSWYIYHETKKVLAAFADDEDQDDEAVDAMESGQHRHSTHTSKQEQLEPPRRRQSRSPSPNLLQGSSGTEELESWDWSDEEGDGGEGPSRMRPSRGHSNGVVQETYRDVEDDGVDARAIERMGLMEGMSDQHAASKRRMD